MKKKRSRTLARSAMRAQKKVQQKLQSARRKLWGLEPGGAPERPLTVSSASVVEPRAESFCCPDCEGPVRVHEHRVDMVAHLRLVELRCRRCGAAAMLYFRIVESLLN